MFGLLCSTNKKKWRLVQIDEDKNTLVKLANELRDEQKKKLQNMTAAEQLVHSIFGTPVEYKIVRIEAEED